MAKTIATKFKAMEKVRLHLMVNIIRRARRSRWGQLLDVVVDQGDVRRVHGDVAAHAPHGDAHEGFFRAGASLMPSPIMHTGWPFCWLASMISSLSSGRQLHCTSGDAQLAGRCAGRRWRCPR